MAAAYHTEKLKLTDERIAATLKKHPKGDVILKDTDCKGLELVRLDGSTRFRYFRKVKGKLYNRKQADWPGVSVAAARELATAYYSSILKGTDPLEQRRTEAAKRHATGVTFREVLEGMIKVGTYSEATVKSYRSAIKPPKGIFAAYADKPLVSITPEIVQKIHTKKSETSKAQANKHCRTLRAVWNYARAAHEVTGDNPVNVLNLDGKVSGQKGWAKVPRRRTAVLKRNRAEWLECMRELQQQRIDPTLQKQAIAAEIMALTGLRRIACLGLRWEWIDLKQGTITIPDKNMKAALEVALPITARVQELLRQAKEICDGSQFVFPSEYHNKEGEHVHIDSINAFTKEMEKRTGQRHTPNDLRRTFQSAAREAGVSNVYVKILMAHAYDETDVTLGYQADDPDVLAEMAQKIEDCFLGKKSVDTALVALMATLTSDEKQKLLMQLTRG